MIELSDQWRIIVEKFGNLFYLYTFELIGFHKYWE